MNMNQKGFANIALIVVIVAVVAVGGYLVFSKKSASPTETQQPQTPNELYKPISERNWQGQGSSYLPDEKDHIQVLFPKGGEKLEVGKTYNIQWNNYEDGRESLTISLSGVSDDNRVVYSEKLGTNVPAKRSGTFSWTVSQPSFARYKVEIYPEGGRELVGRSKDFFSIFGGKPLVVNPPEPPKPLQTDNLIVNVPLTNQSVSNPIVVKGKARNIFFEGEFAIKLLGYDYPLGHPKYAESSRIITSANARIVGDCDWIRNQWCDFEATINYPSFGTGVENMLYFYDGGQGDPGTPAAPKFIAALSIKLK
jgi:hypothetical protein